MGERKPTGKKYEMDMFGNIKNIRDIDDERIILNDSRNENELNETTDNNEEEDLQIIDQTPRYKNSVDKAVSKLNTLSNEKWFTTSLLVIAIYPAIKILLFLMDLILGDSSSDTTAETIVIVDGTALTEEEYNKQYGDNEEDGPILINLIKSIFSFFVNLVKVILSFLAGN